MEKSFRYLPYFFILFSVGVIACFYRSYFGHFPNFKNVISPIGNTLIEITPVTHFHATVILLWLLLLIIQPILIIKKQIKLHHLLGRISYVIVALLTLSLILIVRQEQLRQKNLGVFAANLIDPFLFVVNYGLAIYYRKKPTWHARFMILTITSFIAPALARLLVSALPIIFGWYIMLFIIEWRTTKVYRPYLISLGYFLINLSIVIYLLLVNKALLEKIWSLFFE